MGGVLLTDRRDALKTMVAVALCDWHWCQTNKGTTYTIVFPGRECDAITVEVPDYGEATVHFRGREVMRMAPGAWCGYESTGVMSSAAFTLKATKDYLDIGYIRFFDRLN